MDADASKAKQARQSGRSSQPPIPQTQSDQAVQEPGPSPIDSMDPDAIRIELGRGRKSGPLRKGRGSAAASIGHTRLEPHVLLALKTARALAGDRPIDASMLLRAVLFTKGTERVPRSKAYQQLQLLLPVGGSPPIVDDVEDLSALTFTKPLTAALGHVMSADPADDTSLWGRDLVTAALLTRGDRSLEQIASEAGTTVPELQDRWFAFVTSDDEHRDPDEWAQWWRSAGVPLPAERGVRAGYLPESVDVEDGIGIGDDVDAFVRLFVDDRTALPLSIGLLGDWGAGKSFFMKQVERGVKGRVYDEKGQLHPRVSGRCRHVAQIHFSAWQYSDTNIWASLVAHIFDELWEAMVPPKPKDEDEARARVQVREELEKARGALFQAEAEVQQARAQLVAAEELENHALERLAVRGLARDELVDGMKALAAKVGWTAPLDAIVDLEAARRELRATGQRSEALLQTALRGPALGRAVLAILLTTALFGVLVVVGSHVASKPWARDAVSTLGTVGAVVGSIVSAIAATLGKARSLLTELDDKISKTIADYEKKIEDVVADARKNGTRLPLPTALGERTGQDRTDEQRVAEALAAREALVHLAARVDAARRRVDELERKQASLSPAQRLTTFIEERAGSQDYRSQQGIVSLVHRDFDQLSQLMKRWRNDKGETPPPPGVRPIDRIVLYIDDLDRCPPALVVRTLEAIHLLLALDLFVVVVAVDSRWLLRSLEIYYADLLKEGAPRAFTPQSYLEKIFQITFAVAPMGKAGFERYVESLTGREPPAVTTENEPAEARGEVPDAGTKSSAVATARGRGDEERPTLAQGRTNAIQAVASPEPASQATKPDAAPERTPQADDTRGLSITDTERVFLKKLDELVATPRLLKRLVNVYRLVKSRVPWDELSTFEAEASGRHRQILLLLGILYGRPELSLWLFQRLCEGAPAGDDPHEPLHAALRRTAKDAAAVELGGEALAALVEDIAPEVTVEQCEREAPQLARYSLVTGPYWHTWRRRTRGSLTDHRTHR